MPWCELRDARIPNSSRNPDVDRIVGSKPRLIVLNRADQRGPRRRRRCWKQSVQPARVRSTCWKWTARAGRGVNAFPAAVRTLSSEGQARARRRRKGPGGARPLRVNGSRHPERRENPPLSTRLAGRKAAGNVADRPGVTRGKPVDHASTAASNCWIRPASSGRSFESARRSGELACLRPALIKDNVLDRESSVACRSARDGCASFIPSADRRAL